MFLLSTVCWNVSTILGNRERPTPWKTRRACPSGARAGRWPPDGKGGSMPWESGKKRDKGGRKRSSAWTTPLPLSSPGRVYPPPARAHSPSSLETRAMGNGSHSAGRTVRRCDRRTTLPEHRRFPLGKSLGSGSSLSTSAPSATGKPTSVPPLSRFKRFLGSNFHASSFCPSQSLGFSPARCPTGPTWAFPMLEIPTRADVAHPRCPCLRWKCRCVVFFNIMMKNTTGQPRSATGGGSLKRTRVVPVHGLPGIP